MLMLFALLQQGRFGQMSDAIITRIDEMGNRIDDLEKSIEGLMAQAGVEDGSDLHGNPINAEPAAS